MVFFLYFSFQTDFFNRLSILGNCIILFNSKLNLAKTTTTNTLYCRLLNHNHAVLEMVKDNLDVLKSRGGMHLATQDEHLI